MDRKTLIDLALKAGRKRLSPQTGYVHYCPEVAGGEHHTIPLFENFCFALALFRSKLTENVLEGKALIEKLLKFQVGDQFPVYLHEYPECRNPYLGSRIFYLLKKVLEEFHHVVGADFRKTLETAIQHLQGARQRPTRTPQTPEEWGEALCFSTASLEEALPLWHTELHAYIGKNQSYEKGEPAVTLFDLYMGGLFGSFSKRALEDHPIHLRAALLSLPPFPNLPPPSKQPYFAGSTLFWGGKEKLHSLYCHPKKSTLTLTKHSSFKTAAVYVFHFSETIPEEVEDIPKMIQESEFQHSRRPKFEEAKPTSKQHLCLHRCDADGFKVRDVGAAENRLLNHFQYKQEIAFYCPVHEDTALFVNGKKATAFRLGDQVEIVSQGIHLSIEFTILEGEGRFFGQISRGNRPHQLSCRGENVYAAYDWQIALRTLDRTPNLTLSVSLDFLGSAQGGAVDGNAHSMETVVDIESSARDR